MQRARLPTLKSIADDLGLHVSTVARVLNDGARPGERVASGDTAERIRRRAREVGYRANPHAASLRTRRTQLIGVLVPRLTDVTLATIFAGIEGAAGAHGMIAFVSNTSDDPAVHAARLEMMLDRRVDGLIIADARRDHLDSLDRVRATGVPYVLVNRTADGHPSASCDNLLGGRIAADHLYGLGHRHVGVVAGLAHASTGIDRSAGFVARYAEHGIDVTPDRVRPSDLASTSGRIAAAALLQLHPRPTALFAVNDIAAIGATRAVLDLGLRVGEDVSVLGFNDADLAAELHVPMTTITCEPEEMGRAAMDLVVRRIGGEATGDVLTTPRLIVRNSTRPPPVGA